METFNIACTCMAGFTSVDRSFIRTRHEFSQTAP
jgi:hypothetical protein